MLSLLDDLYAASIIRLGIYREDGKQTLVFGSVELLPREMPAPVERGPSFVPLSTGRKRYLEFWHIVATAEDAIHWYRRCAAGNVLTPKAPCPEGDPIQLGGGPFLDEPPWPNLAVGDPAPFLADWQGCVRSHRLVTRTEPGALASALGPGERDAARKACLDALHFNPFDEPEWLGGLTLIAPNPLYRYAHRRLIPRGSAPSVQSREQTDERTLVHFEPRTGVDLTGLEIYAVERRRSTFGQVRRAVLGNSHHLTFDYPYEVASEGLAVICPQRGLLDIHEPAPYIKTVSMTVATAALRKRVTAPAGRGKPEEIVAVEELSEQERHVGFEPASNNPLVLLAVRQEIRKRREEGRRLGQRWFHGNQREAEAFVRGLVGTARLRVLFVDPYLGGRELAMFGHARTRPAVQIRALTGAGFLRESSADYPGREQGDMVAAVLDGFDKEVGRGRADVRVMPGDLPAIHDRFLIVDEEVWLSGNSLGDVGRRAGVVIRMPDPDPIIAAIEEIWVTASTPFAQWIAARSDARSGRSDGAGS